MVADPELDPGLVAVAHALPQALLDRERLVLEVMGLQGTEEEVLSALHELEEYLVSRFLETVLRPVDGRARKPPFRLAARLRGGIPDLEVTYYRARHPEVFQ